MLLLALLIAQYPSGTDSLFRYDASAPLHARDSLLRTTPTGVRLFEVWYDSPRGGRVDGYLVVPAGAGPFAGIVFGHWGLGNRSEFIPEAIHYAERGAVSILINWPWNRRPPDQRSEGTPDKPEQDRDVHAQAVVDLRRALDLLSKRADVDPARLGYVGHSYGAQFGAVMTANEPRVRAAVLMAGIPDSRTFLIESDDPGIIDYRKKWTSAQIDRYLEVNQVTAAITWVGRISPRPLLMQFGEFEASIPMASMQRYAAAAKDPVTVLWYPTGHELNDPKAWADRTAWVRKQLGLR
jgi:dienelactone hydrolase